MPTAQDDSYEVLGFPDGGDQKAIKYAVQPKRGLSPGC